MATEPTTENLEEIEKSVSIDEYDPSREIEGVHPKIRSCKSCIHASVCKIFEFQVQTSNQLKEIAKRSSVELDITPPEEIGARCGSYQSDTFKEPK